MPRCPAWSTCLTQYAVDHAADAALWMNATGTILYANQAASSLFACPGQELLGQEMHALAPLIAERLSGQSPGENHFESSFRRSDGQSVPVDVSASHIDFDGRVFHCLFVRDISERKQLEQQLRQAHKMEAVGRLVDGVAHDFNNLLTAVMIYTGLLMNQLSAQSPLRRHTNQIVLAAEHGRALIGQLLGFGRYSNLEGRGASLSVPEVLDGMREMLQRLLGEDVVLLIDTASDLGPVQADRVQIEQVIMNLALNARDAMPDGGELRIRCENFEVEPGFARSRIGLQPGAYVRVEVSDTGAGMDAETLTHVFEPFFTTKEKGQGNGLGLAMVYRAVRQSGGHVEIDSRAGRGTAVRMLLLRAPNHHEPAALLPRTEPEFPGNETVLLVEDEELVRRSVREILVKKGYHVLQARHAREALLISRRYPGRIHLMVTDLVLPGMNGGELAEEIQPQRPDMRVLFISGYGDDPRVQHITAAGKPFFRKPFTAAALSRKMREVLSAPPPSTPPSAAANAG